MPLRKTIVSSTEFVYTSGSQSVVPGSQRIRDHFPEDPRIHICNGYPEVYILFLIRNILLKLIVRHLSQSAYFV